jgi:hypothetical protein
MLNGAHRSRKVISRPRLICVYLQPARHSLARRLVHLRLNYLPFASLADVAKGGDGAKSALVRF